MGFPKRQICLVSLQLSCFSFLPSHRAPLPSSSTPGQDAPHVFLPTSLGRGDDDAKTKERRSQHKNFSSPAPSRLFPFLPSVRTPPSPASSPLPAFLLRASPCALPGKIYPQKRQRRRGEGAEGERATKPGFLIKAGLSLFSPSN